jgi:hypothetical protein
LTYHIDTVVVLVGEEEVGSARKFCVVVMMSVERVNAKADIEKEQFTWR